MKKGILTFSILSLLISHYINAEYMINIPLEPQNIKFDSAEVTGDIGLSPSTINRGQSSNIEWSFTYGNEINIEDVGSYQDKVGSVSVNPLVSRSYDVQIKNGDKIRNETLNLTVIQPHQNITFSANPTRIGIGQSSMLTWDVDNSYGVRIDGVNNNNLPLSGSTSVFPTSNTSYTLVATGYEGISDKSETIDIEVVPNAIINNFSVDTDKITRGKSVVFSWNVSNAESLSLNPFGPLVQRVSGTQSIPFNTAGNFAYTLEATSLSGVKDNKSLNISVFDPAAISSFTVNGQKTVDVSPNADLNFVWNTTSAPTLRLNGTTVSGTSQVLTANAQTGSTTYTLQATNGANDSVSDSVNVNVVGPAVINTFTGPTAVFANSPFNLNWTATGANRYTLKSNNATSGVLVTEENMNTSLTKSVTPSTAGSYTYTLAAYNTANAKTEQNKIVSVEADPTFTGFTVNGQSSINVSPSASLNFAGQGISTGGLLQGRNSANTENVTLPPTANTTAGTTTYYAAATKSLNSVTRFSDVRSVSVTVVNAPTIGTITAPTAVFEDAAFTASWSGTNVVNYKIRSNNASSGIAITDVDLGTANSRTITPTAAGSYTYTITATNAANVSTSKTFTVAVEANPTFTGFTVNGGTSINVSPSATLTFTGTGFSAGSALQARNSANTADAVLPSTAPTTFGTYTYYAAAEKTVNSITRYSGLRSVIVNVIQNWVAITPTYTAWTNSGTVYSCTAWSPAASTVTINQSFTQTRSCSQNQTRTKQDREQEQYTKVIRNVGSPVTETNTITVTPSQTATGTKETWIATTPTYTDWVNSGAISGCTNWSPATSTITIGQSFVQTATDCKQTQVRSRQNREIETTTNQVRNVGTPISESQVITVSSSRNAIGSKQTKVCYYTFKTGTSGYSIVKPTGYETNFWWNNELVGSTFSNNIILNGFKYTIGQYKENKNLYGIIINYYEICRESV